MNKNLIFYPILAHIFLVFWLYILLAVRKKKALQAGQVDQARRPLFEDAWPDDVVQVNNNLRNQFQVPILFYMVCVILWAINAVNVWVLVLSSLFVLSRYFHALVHTGSNIVKKRFRMFLFGVVIAIGLAVHALLSLPGGPA